MITSLKWLSTLTLLITGAILLSHAVRPGPQEPYALLLGLLMGALYAFRVSLSELVESRFGGYLYIMGIPLLVVLVPALIRRFDGNFAADLGTLALSFYLGSFGWYTWESYRARAFKR